MAGNAAAGGTPGTGGMPGQAGDGKDDAAGAAAQGGTPAGDGTPPAADDTTGLRKALAAERDAKEELARQLKALTDKDLPEAERTKRERDDLRTQNAGLQAEVKRLTTANAVMAQATKLGFADPADAVAFVNAADVDGSDAKAVEAKLQDLLKTKPYLASAAARPVPGGADLGNKGQPPKAVDMNDAMRRAVGIPTGG